MPTCLNVEVILYELVSKWKGIPEVGTTLQWLPLLCFQVKCYKRVRISYSMSVGISTHAHAIPTESLPTLGYANNEHSSKPIIHIILY